MEALKARLVETLPPLVPYRSCALVGRPGHANIGDSAIWVGTRLCLAEVLQCEVRYVSGVEDYCPADVPDCPLLVHGGGNLGDLWPGDLDFYTALVERYQDRPIVFLPQTVLFSDPSNLARAAATFNQHSNLTVLVRDNVSLNLMQTHFTGCRSALVPDMAIYLAGRPDFRLPPRREVPVVYLMRTDHEKRWESIGARTEDWVAMTWGHGLRRPGLLPASLLRKAALTPETRARKRWLRTLPASLAGEVQATTLVHAGLFQLSAGERVASDRLHGHILASLLGLPNILLPNSYYKNQAWFDTWSSYLSLTTFVTDEAGLSQALLNR